MSNGSLSESSSAVVNTQSRTIASSKPMATPPISTVSKSSWYRPTSVLTMLQLRVASKKVLAVRLSHSGGGADGGGVLGGGNGDGGIGDVTSTATATREKWSPRCNAGCSPWGLSLIHI